MGDEHTGVWKRRQKSLAFCRYSQMCNFACSLHRAKAVAVAMLRVHVFPFFTHMYALMAVVSVHTLLSQRRFVLCPTKSLDLDMTVGLVLCVTCTRVTIFSAYRELFTLAADVVKSCMCLLEREPTWEVRRMLGFEVEGAKLQTMIAQQRRQGCYNRLEIYVQQ